MHGRKTFPWSTSPLTGGGGGGGGRGGGRRGRMQDGDGVGYLRCINNYAIFSAAVMNFTIANAQVVQDLIGMYGSMGFLSASKCLSV